MSFFSILLGCLGILALAIVVALVLLQKLIPKPAPSCLPGPPNGTAKPLFLKAREDAFLLHAKDFSPAQTLVLDTAISSFDPTVLRNMFLSRENSTGRSIVYRMVANIMPSSDGILFSQNEEWRKRHSLLTSLFQPRVISMHTATAFEGALRAAFLHIESENDGKNGPLVDVDYDSSTSLLASIDNPTQPPLGARSFGHEDVITLVRWAAMRNFFSWALGVELDSWGLPEDSAYGSGASVLYPTPVQPEDFNIARCIRRLGRTLDAYARVCFEIMPVAERADVGTWLKEYAQLWSVSRRLKSQLKTFLSYHPGTEKLIGASKQSAQPLLVKDVSNDSKRARATNTSALYKPLSPDTFVTRLLHANWDLNAIVSEVNHLHGAHKAVAFLTTCAIIELSSPGAVAVREALVQEFATVCGLPPTHWTCGEMLRHVHAHAGTNGTEETQKKGTWRLPTKADLDGGKLPVLQSVWKETLRRHPVSMGVMRKTGEPLEVPLRGGSGDEGGDSVTLEAGHDMVLLLHALHHHDAFWGEDSHHWIPDRWNENSAYWTAKRAQQESIPPKAAFPAKVKDVFFPFLEGLRRCAGMTLAEQQFMIFVYTLVGIMNMRAEGPAFPAKDELPALVKKAKESAKSIQRSQHIVPPGPNPYYLPDIGGGIAVLPETILLDRQGGVALLVDTLPNAKGDMELRPRWHLVKRADMFTAIDGRVSYSFAPRSSS